MNAYDEKQALADGRISSGVAGLDNILGGGLPSNHLYLLEGDPGTGKTTLALQFLLAGAAAGERCLYVTLSESKRELLWVAQSHGWSLDGIRIYEMSPQDEDVGADAQYTVFHPSEVELADTTTAMLKQVEEVQPSRVVLDSLSELRMLARDPLRYRRQILGLKRHFAGRNCTVLLLDDRTAATNDVELQSIVHGVVMMQALERDFGVKTAAAGGEKAARIGVPRRLPRLHHRDRRRVSVSPAGGLRALQWPATPQSCQRAPWNG